jgi:ferredoxin
MSSNSPISFEPNHPPGFNHPPQQSQQTQPMHHEDFAKNECYICKGFGHWARNCTSLPSVYLVENPPKCYSCHGVGHYARFCPNGALSVSFFTKLS